MSISSQNHHKPSIPEVIHSINALIAPIGLQAQLKVFGDRSLGTDGIYFFDSAESRPITVGRFILASQHYYDRGFISELTKLAASISPECEFYLPLADVLSERVVPC